ncbi:unnamed protein product [Owenia fusiformis]|uniref:Uncharacterized protein n=1 Tax=Owenia fusiformis TaxID=6347 RepID=A0A8J1XFZ0_OWEFU|nr:unnamed protein product [Owenia fusiformis]
MARKGLGTYIPVGIIILSLYLVYFWYSNLVFVDTNAGVERHQNDFLGVIKEDTRTKGDGPYITANRRLTYTTNVLTLTLANNKSHYERQQIESSLLHEFSPDIEDRVRNLFINDTGDNDQLEFHVISPAILPYKGNIMVVARVWLNYERRYHIRDKEMNRWIDNYLYTQMFDGNMRPLSSGNILGIPVPVQYSLNTGCSDARIFNWMGSLMILFYMAMKDNEGTDIGHLFILDYDRNILRKPKIVDHKIANIDSNWSPLVIDDSLHFVYTLDPLRILKCLKDVHMDIICHFVTSLDTTLQKYPFDVHRDILRGGSPFMPYKESYFISVAHSTLTYFTPEQDMPHPVYGAHIVLLKVYPFRIIHVSEPFKIHPRIYDNIPLVRKHFILAPFFYPTGLIVENSDTIDIGVHINDYRAFIVRVTGIENILNKAMKSDSRNDDSMVTSRPRFIQDFVKLSLRKSHFNQTWTIEEQNGKQIIS